MNATTTVSSKFFTTVAENEGREDLTGTIVKVVVLAILSLVGTVGNLIVIITIRKERKLSIPGNNYIINLAVADLIITAFSIPVILMNIIRESDAMLMEKDGFCQASAYLKVVALHVSWYSLAFIALNRYYSVCRMSEYANHFTKKNILMSITCIWIWVILINLPVMVGWAIPSDKELEVNGTEGYYLSYPRDRPPVIYDISSHDCVLGVGNRGGYTYANGIFVMTIPLAAIILCYSMVYMAIVQSRRKMKKAMDKKQLKIRYKKERKLSFMFSVVVFVFLLCWLPAIIYDYNLNPRNNAVTERNNVRLVINWLALSNSAMNSILFAAMSKAFRVGYKRLLLRAFYHIVGVCCGCCKCGRSMQKSLQDKINSSVHSNSVKMRPRRQTGMSSLVEVNVTTHSQNVNSTNPHNIEHTQTHLKVPRLSLGKAGSMISIHNTAHQRAKQEVTEETNGTTIELFTPEGIYLGNRHIKPSLEKFSIDDPNRDSKPKRSM